VTTHIALDKRHRSRCGSGRSIELLSVRRSGAGAGGKAYGVGTNRTAVASPVGPSSHSDTNDVVSL